MALPEGDKKERKAFGHLVHEDLWEEEGEENTNVGHYRRDTTPIRPITSVTRGEYTHKDGTKVKYYLTTELKADRCALCSLGLCVQRVESSDLWDADDVVHISAYSAGGVLLS